MAPGRSSGFASGKSRSCRTPGRRGRRPLRRVTAGRRGRPPAACGFGNARRDEHCSSGSPQANNRPQGDLWPPVGHRDLPPANCVRAERRGVEDAAPYGVLLRGVADVPLRHADSETHVGTSIARPVRRRRTIARRAIYGPRSVIGICLRQIAFVPNAGRSMIAPTAWYGGAYAGASPIAYCLMPVASSVRGTAGRCGHRPLRAFSCSPFPVPRSLFPVP